MTPSNLTRSTTTFALTVEDINDNAPNFTKAKYNGRVDENATISISFDENIQVEDIDQVEFVFFNDECNGKLNMVLSLIFVDNIMDD